MRKGVWLLLLLAAVPAPGQDLVVAEHSSVGLDPYTKFCYVNRYTSNFQFLGTMASYPLLTGSPSAALLVGDVLYVGEGNCAGFGGSYVCAPRVARHDARGEVRNVGPPLQGRVKSIRRSRRNELVVTTIAEIARIDLETGASRGTFAIPLTPGSDSFVTDGDVDASGCSVAIGVAPASVLLVDVCGEPFAITKRIVSPALQALWGVRFLDDGDLLVSARSLVRISRDGTIRRTYSVTGGGSIEVTPDGKSVVLASGPDLTTIDLESGATIASGRIRSGIYVDSLAFSSPPSSPPLRRRGVRPPL